MRLFQYLQEISPTHLFDFKIFFSIHISENIGWRPELLLKYKTYFLYSKSKHCSLRAKTTKRELRCILTE